ncbi:PAS domain S-box protein (plasmid) [Haloferacaceae archaeon DSL9]
MGTSAPSPTAVLEVVDALAPAGTPLTTPEVADEFDCTARTIYNKLELLVQDGVLRTKKVGARGRVWWRPPKVRSNGDDAEAMAAVDSSVEATADVLRKNGDRLRLALRAASLGVWELDLRTESSPVRSPRHDRIFGYEEPLDDWNFERFLEHVHPEDRDYVQGSFEGAFDVGTWEFECRIIRADDSLRWITANGEFFFDDEGEPVRAVGVVKDITTRKRREQRLERYAKIIDTIGDPVYELDAEGRFIFVNDSLVEYTGYEKSDLSGRDVSIVLDDRSTERLRSQIAGLRSAGDGETATLRWELITKDGERIPVENRLSLLTGADGRFRGSVGVLRDVSERERQERALRESEQRYRTLVDNFPNGIVTLFDEDLRYLIAGGELYEAFDRSPEETVGKTLYERSSPEEVEILESPYRSALRGKSRAFEVEYAGFTLQFWIVPVRDDSGNVVAGMAMSQDITERKRHEEQLETLNHLNEIVQKTTHLTLDSSTRDEIERTVCDRLSDSDSYAYAWFGHLDRRGQSVAYRTAGTDEDGRSEITIPISEDDSTSAESIAEAIRARELRRIRTQTPDPVFARWVRSGDPSRYSGISVPVVYKTQVYGVLNIYTARKRAYGEYEQRLMEHLGEVIGHAINSLERKRALLENRVHEITMRSDSLERALSKASDEDEVTVSIDRTITLPEGRTISYYTVDGLDPEMFIELVREFQPDAEIRLIERTTTQSRVEITTSADTIATTLATYGGRIVKPIFQDGAFRITVHLPYGADIRQFKEAIRTAYPDMDFLSQTQVTRQKETVESAVATLDEQLTQRQRTVLEVAYYSGFFNWPRDSTGEELAERLGLAPSTMHHHLRHGENKLISAFIDVEQKPDV